jgi:hypothetical protein
MRKLSFLLAFSLSAALAGPAKLVVESQQMGAGELIVQVRNLADVPATAVLAGSETNFATVDVLLGARNGRLLEPAETVEVRIPNADAAGTLAAIFEDGTTTGDWWAVLQLIQARQKVYSDLPQALAFLRLAETQSISAATVSGWFRQWQQRWLASRPGDVKSVPLAAELFLKRAGSERAAGPAHELIGVFEDLSAKLAASKPEL